MRLYVDCDDTLVLWLDGDGDVADGPNPYGTGPDRWKPNEGLIIALENWRMRHPEIDEIVLWTGGGTDYAQLWLRRVYPAADDAISKDTRIPRPDDLCVDDMPIKVACPVVTWQQFVKEWSVE
jgi:hypothetical protein